MSFILRNTLVIASLLLISNVHSEQNIVTPLGGGKPLLASNTSNKDDLPNVNASFNVCDNLDEGKQFLKNDSQYTILINKIRSEVDALDDKTIYKKMDEILNSKNEKIKIIDGFAYFTDCETAILSKYLLKRIINIQKFNSNTITANDHELFYIALWNLSDENWAKRTLVQSLIMTIFLEQCFTNNKQKIPVWDEIANLATNFLTSDAPNNNWDRKVITKFCRAFFKKYLDISEHSSELAKKMLQNILNKKETPVTNFDQLYEQLLKLDFGKYYDMFSEYNGQILSKNAIIDFIKKNQEYAIKDFNKARNIVDFNIVNEAYKHIILTSNQFFKDKLSQNS